MSNTNTPTGRDTQQNGVRARHESKYFWLIDEAADQPGEACLRARHKDTIALEAHR